MADILSLRKGREALVAMLTVDYDDQVQGIVPDSHVKLGSTVQRPDQPSMAYYVRLPVYSMCEAHSIKYLALHATYEKLSEATETMNGWAGKHPQGSEIGWTTKAEPSQTTSDMLARLTLRYLRLHYDTLNTGLELIYIHSANNNYLLPVIHTRLYANLRH